MVYNGDKLRGEILCDFHSFAFIQGHISKASSINLSRKKKNQVSCETRIQSFRYYLYDNLEDKEYSQKYADNYFLNVKIKLDVIYY